MVGYGVKQGGVGRNVGKREGGGWWGEVGGWLGLSYGGVEQLAVCLR